VIMKLRLLVLSLCALPACGDAPERQPAPPAQAEVPAARPHRDHAWRINPPGAGLVVDDSAMHITTGPHVVVWDTTTALLAPPYVVSATLQKQTGRLHEGVGLIFGASRLDRPENEQVYSYFLVRGDGSFLIKRRDGAATPVVRDWTRHPVVRRDADGSGRPNALEVSVSDSVAVFRINGTEVARVPAAELSTRGSAGVRAAHDLELTVTDFSAAGRS
jgi:hypothetical protein